MTLYSFIFDRLQWDTEQKKFFLTFEQAKDLLMSVIETEEDLEDVKAAYAALHTELAEQYKKVDQLKQLALDDAKFIHQGAGLVAKLDCEIRGLQREIEFWNSLAECTKIEVTVEPSAASDVYLEIWEVVALGSD